MTTASETALQAKSIAPGLTCDNLAASIKFYEGLGFAVEDRWENNGELVGVMMRAGSARIGLGQDDWKKGRDRVKGVGMRIWLGTEQSIDEIAERAKASGVKLAKEPHDTEWGARAFEVIDPDGFLLSVSNDKM